MKNTHKQHNKGEKQMKKLIVPTLAAIIACPAFADYSNSTSTWQPWGWDMYVGLHGGLSYTNLNYSFNNNKESIGDLAWQGHAALGLELCKTLRTELEWSIFSKTKDTKDFGDAGSYEVSTKLQTLLMNFYMEFGDWQIIRPFVGIGAGVGFAKIDAKNPAPTFDKTKFSMMGTLGITFDMERFAIDIAGRYNYVDIASGLHNFGGDIGIRFMF